MVSAGIGNRESGIGKGIVGFFALFVMMLSSAVSVHAATHTIIEEESFIQFTATVNNAGAAGRFTDYDADIHFYPDDLENSHVKVVVHLKPDTITADYDEVAENLATKPWLDVKQNPMAIFEVKDFEKNTHNTYHGYGRLTLLGQTHPVKFFFILSAGQEGKVVANATVTLSRLKFGVGKGEWEATDTVADVVAVNAHFVTMPTEQAGEAGKDVAPLFDESLK